MTVPSVNATVPFMLPSASAKRTLAYFADSIELAARLAPAKWGVTPHADGPRLNVGFCEALTIYPDFVRVLALRSLLPPRGRGIEFSLEKGYPSCPGSVLAHVPASSPSRLLSTLTVLRPAHVAAIETSARRGFNAGAREGHSDDAVQTIGLFLKRALPSPQFTRKSRPDDLWEGAVERATATRYERNAAARAACIAKYGSSCVVCGMLFEQVYGRETRGLIHVHHLRPLASGSGRHKVDPIVDLRPVCPNCHAVIHSTQPPLSIEDVKRYALRQARASAKKQPTGER